MDLVQLTLATQMLARFLWQVELTWRQQLWQILVPYKKFSEKSCIWFWSCIYSSWVLNNVHYFKLRIITACVQLLLSCCSLPLGKIYCQFMSIGSTLAKIFEEPFLKFPISCYFVISYPTDLGINFLLLIISKWIV